MDLPLTLSPPTVVQDGKTVYYNISGDLLGLSEFHLRLVSNVSGRGTCDRDGDGDAGVFTFHLSAILFLATICIVGNSTVIFVMMKEKKSLNSPLNYFITSLAVSDLFQGIIYGIYNLGHINVDNIRFTIGKSLL